ncbi:MAG: zf-HC2 domain-containing protein [Candidatus Zixiibacteriota bacterium]
MTCRHALSLVDDLLDGELSSPVAEQVRQHIDHCPSCRDEYESSRRLKQLLGWFPSPDPGHGYWIESARLIQARTTDRGEPDVSVRIDGTVAGRTGRLALTRAVVSLAASLFVLLAAILLGTDRSEQLARINRAEAPIMATAPVSELIGPDRMPLVTENEQIRLAKGMLLMGSPGFLGRFTGLPDLTKSFESQ